jgi:hypothetical protein
MATAPKTITEYRLSEHAVKEMTRRGITEEQVAIVLRAPEQSEPVREGREVYHSRFALGEPPKTYLIRVIVDYDREPPVVVTAYRTSKVEKYWRTDEDRV